MYVRNSLRILLLAALLFSGPATADSIRGTTRTIDYIGGAANTNIQFRINQSSSTVSPLVLASSGNGSVAKFGPGSVSSPTYSFIGDTDTGMYSDASNVLKFATSGTLDVSFTTSGIQTYASGVGGGEIKWVVFTGNILSLATAPLVCPSGCSAILSVAGRSTRSGGSNFGADIQPNSAGITNQINFYDLGESGSTASTTQTELFNRDASNANDYKVLMMYK